MSLFPWLYICIYLESLYLTIFFLDQPPQKNKNKKKPPVVLPSLWFTVILHNAWLPAIGVAEASYRYSICSIKLVKMNVQRCINSALQCSTWKFFRRSSSSTLIMEKGGRLMGATSQHLSIKSDSLGCIPRGISGRSPWRFIKR